MLIDQGNAALITGRSTTALGLPVGHCEHVLILSLLGFVFALQSLIDDPETDWYVLATPRCLLLSEGGAKHCPHGWSAIQLSYSDCFVSMAQMDKIKLTLYSFNCFYVAQV